VEWWYSWANSDTGLVLHQTTTSLTNTYPQQSFLDDYGTDGTGPTEDTNYMKHWAKIKHIDSAEICDSANSTRENRVGLQTCEA
jgi:hypothetical protein